MNNMRRGFTMIELIFVIVIIGILAAVAIPKLSATRDDAKISNLVANARTLAGDMSSHYTSQGQANWLTALAQDVSNVPLETACGTDITATQTIAGATFVLCDEPTGIPCVTIVTDANGTSYSMTATAATTSQVCNGVAIDPAVIGLSGNARGTAKTTTLGGASVVR